MQTKPTSIGVNFYKAARLKPPALFNPKVSQLLSLPTFSTYNDILVDITDI